MTAIEHGNRRAEIEAGYVVFLRMSGSVRRSKRPVWFCPCKNKRRAMKLAKRWVADVSYDELAERLTKIGIKESKATIANKLSRGAFSAVFMVAVLKAIGRESISLSDI